MSDVGTTDRDLGTDSGLRNTLESAVATAAPGGPDVDSAVSGLVEQRDRNIRKLNDASTPADRSDRLRAAIRAAVHEAKNKASTPKPGNGSEAPIGPPVTWSKDAQAQWESLPHEVRMAAKREQKAYADTVQPIVQRYTEMEQAIAPHRDIIPKHISEPAAVNELFQWYRALNSPHKATALAVLMQQTGTSLQDVANVVAQAQGYYQQQPQQNQQYEQQPQHQQQAQYEQVAQTLAEFSKGRPHFENVRRDMGVLLQLHPEQYLTSSGTVDLERAYNDAVKAAGIAAGASSSRKRDVSPSTRSPSADLTTTHHGKGIRGAIKSAIQESRGRM